MPAPTGAEVRSAVHDAAVFVVAAIIAASPVSSAGGDFARIVFVALLVPGSASRLRRRAEARGHRAGLPERRGGEGYNAAMTDRATPFDSLKPLAGRTLEAALNRALALDPETRDALRALDGRRVALHVAAPPLAVQVTVRGDRLEVGPVAEGSPDLSVRSTLGGLIGQLPFLRNDHAPPVGRLRIEGDADLARRLQRLAERFDPDWQQPFASVFGDVLGVQIANGFAAGLRRARSLAGAAAADLAEYVTEESRDVVGRHELEAFHDDVDVLRDDVERVAARVMRLRGSLRA